jgi:hypothetical protein
MPNSTADRHRQINNSKDRSIECRADSHLKSGDIDVIVFPQNMRRRIQDWLGHRSIAQTTRYTQLSAAPFKDFWR